MKEYRDAIQSVELTRRTGVVRQLTGLAIEASGPDASIGELCIINPRPGSVPLTKNHANEVKSSGPTEGVLAEVVGLKPGHVTLMSYGSVQGIASGSEVIALGSRGNLTVGNGLLGRVIDGFGNALDGLPSPRGGTSRPILGSSINPMQRPRIQEVMQTGVRAIDTLLTVGKGQRVGIFAGSGVGKSTLLGMIARHVQADVNVIALIGERGREVREFIDKQLGVDGLQRSVVVVATADQPALARLRAAHAAVAIAEHFRDTGQQVLLTMDSITRFAMARREVGLSVGEPPTARGYTPSVFAELPQLCERCGTAPSGGSITALLTVLVEGDDLNEPISDCLRAVLDGHIVLSRQLAHQGHYPAIDLLKSASRLMPDLATSDQRAFASEAVRVLAILERNRQLVDIGAYEHGSNSELDGALVLQANLMAFLRQDEGGVSRSAALRQLAELLQVSVSASTDMSGPRTAPMQLVAAPSGTASR
jgi:flagellum-specific ATP synthase